MILNSKMKLKFLGTGTSQGIPVIGSKHPVCLSQNPKDKRLRSSAIITTNDNKKILIDCGPDFRQQMLSFGESHIDALLVTHEHNDHIIGLDDLRPIIFNTNKNIPIYCLERVSNEIMQRFPYAFATEKYPGAPSFDLYKITDQSFELLETLVEPIEVLHGKLPILGYKIGSLAYVTDASFISEKQLERLKNLDILIINCLRAEEAHTSHFILPQVFDLIEILKPKMTYLTHISHRLGFHDEIESLLPPHIKPAYDGLEIFW
ncbi:MBL fold metallo-hydrolase [Riemerella anatipestifer]|nr:MBL fold metallo-hydrolase [Riemerella anatipestifer]MDY3532533.1 MBL fold metallo-hydrolase [Riemerella anatipestifer]MDY3534912.1 MBL fold metallo-hydrolase [Riemerella anatipestifer]